MKKLIPILFLSLVVILPIKVKALSVDKNNLTIEKNNSETIGLYAEVETEVTEISFSLVYTTYDIPAYFNVEQGLTDNGTGISHKIVFSEPVTGKIKLGNIKTNVIANPKVKVGTINIHTANAIDTNGNSVKLNAQIINVAIKTTPVENTQEPAKTTTPEEQPKNLLERIESELVEIELKENTYEYTVNIKKDIEELDLKPIAKDEKYKIDITTQKISELKDNQIIITVEDGDNTEEYKIKVNVLEVDKVEIDDETFESTYKYKGKWITLIVILSIIMVVGFCLNKKK